MFFYIIIFVVGFVALARFGDFLLRSLISLARFFHLPEYTAAFIFVGVATSIPELFVGLSAAVNNIPQFSLGNILGSNFLNVTLVIGVVALLGKGLYVEAGIFKKNFFITSALVFLPLFMAMDGVVSRGDGLILLLAFLFYILILRREKDVFIGAARGAHRHSIFNLTSSRRLLYFFLGAGLLILSSFLVVWAGKNLMDITVLSAFSFGVIFVSIGTVLPELTFGIRSRLASHGSMVMGNFLGSTAFKSAFIIGLVSLISPIKIYVSLNLLIIALFLFLALLLLYVFVFSGSRVSRAEGIILLSVYALFLVFEYWEYFYSAF